MEGLAAKHVHTLQQACTTFNSAITKEKFQARIDATRKTSNVIYLTECQKCQQPYVLEMENPLHIPIYRSDYCACRKLPDKPVTVHLNLV